MANSVADKLRKITGDIAADGCAPITRLTVLKKWFEQPGRMPAFALWMAILAERNSHPTDAYQLAAKYCRAYNPRYPEGLVAQSRAKVLAISRWMDKVQAWEGSPHEFPV